MDTSPNTREPQTEELLDELRAAPSPDSFLDEHEIGCRSLHEYLAELLERKGLERVRVVRMADLNPTYGYQIFEGQRTPSRDKILQIAFAMALTLRETNRALNSAGASALYCKNRRDAIIIFCIDHGYGLQRANEELYRLGERTVC